MEFTENGFWKLKSGTIIKDFDLTHLTREDAMELYDTPANLYDILIMRKNQNDLLVELKHFETKFDKKFDQLDSKIEKTVKEIHICPADKKAIDLIIEKRLHRYQDKEDEKYDTLNQRIDERISEYLKTSILTTANVLKAIATILSILGAFGGIIYLITKQMEKV